MQRDFIDDDHRTIPKDLLCAAATPEGFVSVHLLYWQRYGGQWGLCTYRDAYEYLTSDLSEHGLPCRYSSYYSFKSNRRSILNSISKSS